MKKMIGLLVFICSMFLLPMAAIAEAVVETAEAVAETTPLPTDPFSWEQLATIAGATTATLLIVQLLKLPLDKIWKIPTRIVVYVISLGLMLVASGFTVGLTWSNAGLCAVNAVIVALAAMGAYELTFRVLDDKKKATVEE